MTKDQQNKPEDWQESSRKKKSSKAYLKYSGMAFQMIAVMLLFLFLGQFLDKQFNLDYILTTVFLIIGVFMSVGFFVIQILKEE